MEQFKNEDGTYNGAKALAKLTGRPIAEIKGVWEKVKENEKKLSECPYHEFEQSPYTATMRSLTSQRYVCKHCGGEVGWSEYHWHEIGRRAKK